MPLVFGFKMELISHRGNNNHYYFENTKDAILNSLRKSYIAGVEIDVRITKDKEVVLSHDPFVDLASDGMGEIKDLTLAELKDLTFGTKEKISTLDEVLSEINNKKKIIIELKEESKKYKEFVDIVYRIIKKYPYLNISVCSFNYRLAKYFKSNYKDIKVGLIIGYKANTLRFYNHFDFNSIIKKYAFRAQKGDYIWTINNAKELSNLREDIAIITDKPYLLKSYISKDKIKNA